MQRWIENAVFRESPADELHYHPVGGETIERLGERPGARRVWHSSRQPDDGNAFAFAVDRIGAAHREIALRDDEHAMTHRHECRTQAHRVVADAIAPGFRAGTDDRDLHGDGPSSRETVRSSMRNSMKSPSPRRSTGNTTIALVGANARNCCRPR